GEAFDLLFDAVAGELFDRPHNLNVNITAHFAEDAAVRHLMRQGMLEAVLDIGKKARLVWELCSLKAGQRLIERIFRQSRDVREERERNIPADDRGHLKQVLAV